jgi:hypothetical protein
LESAGEEQQKWKSQSTTASPSPSLMVRRKEKMRNYEDLLKDEVSFFGPNFVRLLDTHDASSKRSINSI